MILTDLLGKINLKNKIFFFTLIVIVFLSLGINVIDRWFFVSHLKSNIERKGVGIAEIIGEKSNIYIRAKDTNGLNDLLLNTVTSKDNNTLISYLFIADEMGNILAHTFSNRFQEIFLISNEALGVQRKNVKEIKIDKSIVSPIEIPIWESDLQIGTVHLGLNKTYINDLLTKFPGTSLSLVILLTLIFLGISYYLSQLITKPMGTLTKISDDISRGNLDIPEDIGREVKCWEIKQCGEVDCPAYDKTDRPCWYVDQTLRCGGGISGFFPEKVQVCRSCDIYQKHVGDEFVQLNDSIRNMMIRLKSSELGLRESEEKYRSLFDSGPNPIFVLESRSLEILDANLDAEKTYNYSREELIGMPFTELGSFGEERSQQNDPGSIDHPKVPAFNQKVRHYKKDKNPIYMNIHSCPTMYGEKEAIIVATTDITEMMEKDAQLIQAGKMSSLGEMSAGIAHELNQPLNAIKIGNEYLRRVTEGGKEIPKDDLVKVTLEVRDQVDKAADIINRLREFGRKAEFTKEKVGINKPIQNVFQIIGQQLKLQNIKVTLDLDDSLPSILAHNNRLEQVVFNLVSNARDAINQWPSAASKSAHRSIGVRSFMDRNRVALSVSDSGAGISDVDREKIFEPFFSTKDAGQGMGLGLSITYGIVKDYDGDIQVDSEEGMGTTFTLTFPKASE